MLYNQDVKPRNTEENAIQPRVGFWRYGRWLSYNQPSTVALGLLTVEKQASAVEKQASAGSKLERGGGVDGSARLSLHKD